MCIGCRSRKEQSTLIRLQCVENKLVFFTNRGRSFYLCHKCIKKSATVKKIVKQCGNIISTEDILKIVGNYNKELALPQS